VAEGKKNRTPQISQDDTSSLFNTSPIKRERMSWGNMINIEWVKRNYGSDTDRRHCRSYGVALAGNVLLSPDG
jgi:hypothetical protein